MKRDVRSRVFLLLMFYVGYMEGQHIMFGLKYSSFMYV